MRRGSRCAIIEWSVCELYRRALKAALATLLVLPRHILGSTGEIFFADFEIQFANAQLKPILYVGNRLGVDRRPDFLLADCRSL